MHGQFLRETEEMQDQWKRPSLKVGEQKRELKALYELSKNKHLEQMH